MKYFNLPIIAKSHSRHLNVNPTTKIVFPSYKSLFLPKFSSAILSAKKKKFIKFKILLEHVTTKPKRFRKIRNTEKKKFKRAQIGFPFSFSTWKTLRGKENIMGKLSKYSIRIVKRNHVVFSDDDVERSSSSSTQN